MKKDRLIPKRRFKEFENNEAWEQRKLLDSVLKVIDFRGRTPKKLGLDWSEDGYLALSALNVKDGYIDESIDAHYGNQELYDKWMNGNELHQGQVLFTTEAPMGNVAQVPDNKRYILSQRTIAFEVDEKIITEDYLATVLRSSVIFNKLTALSSGGTAKGVSQKSMSELTIPIPKNLVEQTKIGEFFSNLDNLITLHQRKLEKLKELKLAYLSEMFPKEGEKYPKRRFSGFTDPWEQRKLGEVGKTFTGLSGKTKKDFGHGDAEFVTYMNIYSNTIANVNQTESVEIDERQNEVEYGDIFFTTSSETPEEVGMSSVWLGNKPNVYLNSFCFGYRPVKKLNPYFMAYMLRSPEIRMKFLLLSQGISRYNISKIKAMDLPIFIPKVEEQLVIGKFFKQLDNLITLHQRKLEKLKNIKKAYLNEMFV